MTTKVSAIALSKDVRKVTDLAEGLDADLLADRTPLVVNGMQLIPSAAYRFSKTDHTALYVELYAPLLASAKPPKVGLEYLVINKQTGKQEVDAGIRDTSANQRPGNPVVPLGLKLPVEQLPPGSYRVELRAMDSAGNHAPPRSVDFEVQ